MVSDQWIKKTLCVSYSSELILDMSGNLPVVKAETMCWKFYWVYFLYVVELTSDKSRQSKLATLLSWFWVVSGTEQWLKQTLLVSQFTEIFWVIFGNWPGIKHTLRDSYFTKLIWVTFDNWPVKKAEILCLPFIELILFTFDNWPVNKIDTMC